MYFDLDIIYCIIFSSVILRTVVGVHSTSFTTAKNYSTPEDKHYSTSKVSATSTDNNYSSSKVSATSDAPKTTGDPLKLERAVTDRIVLATLLTIVLFLIILLVWIRHKHQKDKVIKAKKAEIRAALEARNIEMSQEKVDEMLKKYKVNVQELEIPLPPDLPLPVVKATPAAQARRKGTPRSLTPEHVPSVDDLSFTADAIDDDEAQTQVYFGEVW